jgi:hypothetical protein
MRSLPCDSPLSFKIPSKVSNYERASPGSNQKH